jgi:hypothetical protein
VGSSPLAAALPGASRTERNTYTMTSEENFGLPVPGVRSDASLLLRKSRSALAGET